MKENGLICVRHGLKQCSWKGVGKLRLGYSYSDVLDVLPDVLDWVGIDTFSVNFSQSKALRIHELWQDKLFSALSDYSDQLEED